jgi:hypothetical protein
MITLSRSDPQLENLASLFVRVFDLDQCANLQKCYPVKLGEALPVVLRPAASQDRCQDGMQGLEELRWAKAQQSSRFVAPLDAGSLSLRSPVRSTSAVLVTHQIKRQPAMFPANLSTSYHQISA